MANWHAIKDEWETTTITLASLADKHGVTLGTLKSRKSREKWERLVGVKVQTKNKTVEQVSAKRVEVAEPAPIVVNVDRSKPTKKRAYAKPVTNAPWMKYLPDEVVDLMQGMEQADPIDILYDQIRLQWAMIIRAQDIMFVWGQEDTTRFKSSSSTESDSWETHASWDKQGKFMAAMSSAQKELRFLIQQFMDIAPVEDERRARIEAIEANTELTQARTKLIKGGTKDTAMLDVLIDAVTGGNQ